MSDFIQDILTMIDNAKPEDIILVFVIWTLVLLLIPMITVIKHDNLKAEIEHLEYRNKRLNEMCEEYISIVEKRSVPKPLADAPVKKENIFADVYGLSKDRFEMPKESAVAMIICPKCSWKGRVDETISTYGHTICPYCHEEFREFVR